MTGFDDGAEGTFNEPKGLTFDPSSNMVYVADTSNSAIRAVAVSTGVVSTLAGGAGNGDCIPAPNFQAGACGFLCGFCDGVGPEASFYHPQDVAFDPSSNTLYVADGKNHAIRAIAVETATVTTLAGGTGSGFGAGAFEDGTGTEASFSVPGAIDVDSHGTVYVAEISNNAVRAIAVESALVTTLGGSISGTPGAGDGLGTTAAFNSPTGLAVYRGSIIVADGGNMKIRSRSCASGFGAQADGSCAGCSAGQSTSPAGPCTIVSPALLNLSRGVVPQPPPHLLTPTSSARPVRSQYRISRVVVQHARKGPSRVVQTRATA